MPRTTTITPDQFTTFGEFLRFLRRKAELTQRELAIAVGYSESLISRLEKNERAPDKATLFARFVPALYIEDEPPLVARLLELGAATHLQTSQADAVQLVTEPKSTPHNLPIQLTSFIGREKEISEIKRLLTDRSDNGEGNVRLLTLTGHGGCGKTRLALQAATGLLDAFPDGICFVEFASLTDASLVTETLADILKIKEEPDSPLISLLTDHLRNRKMLLVFDNCEHLIAEIAQLSDTILHTCPEVCILATSREILGVAGEHPFYVPSLSMPNLRPLPSADQLSQYEAVRLFVDRAAIVMPDFTLDEETAPAIVQICQRLDGIPLALELAAARVKVLSVQQIAARLADTFRLLTGGNRTAMPRQQTLQAAMDWGYDLLPEMERRLFNRLSVFTCGWTLEAAESICTGEGIETAQILDGLEQLANKSLVIVEHEQRGEARYHLLEIIRQYARMKLKASGEADTVRRRHATFYLELAEAGAPHAPKDPTKPDWLDRLEIENANLRAALTWIMSIMGNTEFAQRQIRTGHIQTSAWALNRLGWLARERGDVDSARARLEQSLSIYRELDDKLGVAWSAVTLGEVLIMKEEFDLATSILEEGLKLARAQGEGHAIGWALNHLGHVAQLNGDLEQAAHLHDESRAMFQSLGPYPSGLAWAYHGLAETALAQNKAELAAQYFTESLNIFLEIDDGSGMLWCAEGMAGVAVLNKKLERAAWLWGAAENLRKTFGVREAPAARATHERLLAEVSKELGQKRFHARWAEGAVASPEEMLAEVTKP